MVHVLLLVILYALISKFICEFIYIFLLRLMNFVQYE
jgi:hypothetical protein